MPKRALMTADAVGGVWSYAMDLSAALTQRGVAVTLAVLGPAPRPQQRAEAEAAGVTLIETGLPLDWTADTPDQVLQAGAAIAALARDSGADLVHLNSPALAACGGFDLPVVALCHSCVATWWQAVRGGALPPDLAWRAELTGAGYRAADALIAPSAAFARATAVAYGLATPPQVVPNGRSWMAGAPLAAERPARHALTAGRLWDEGKNIAILDRAAARLGAPIYAIGPLAGPNGAAIAVRHLRSLGTLDAGAVALRLARASVFVSPARYEPFGLAVLEAAQAGCALVLSDIPTFREMWSDAACFVPPEDDAAIAAAIAKLLGDRRLRIARGRAARARALRYGVDRMAEGVLRIYAALLSSRAPWGKAA